MAAPRLVVGAVLVDDHVRPRRVLVARRVTGGSDVAGRWEFPGGKLEAGETPVAALQRELREELAIEATIGAEVGDGTGWTINDRLVLRLFVGQISAGRPTPGLDHDAVRWLGPDELDTVDWLGSDRDALPLVRGLLVS